MSDFPGLALSLHPPACRFAVFVGGSLPESDAVGGDLVLLEVAEGVNLDTPVRLRVFLAQLIQAADVNRVGGVDVRDAFFCIEADRYFALGAGQGVAAAGWGLFLRLRFVGRIIGDVPGLLVLHVLLLLSELSFMLLVPGLDLLEQAQLVVDVHGVTSYLATYVVIRQYNNNICSYCQYISENNCCKRCYNVVS